jgi:hypothetical protein
MPLTRGRDRGFDSYREVYKFTMFSGEEEVNCAISSLAMDDLDETNDVTLEQRREQFHRIRSKVEHIAERKFFEGPLEINPDEPVLVRTDDLRLLR